MSAGQIREVENWGKSQNGYVGGGNYEEDPTLKAYTVRKYQQMKGEGQLSSLG